MSFAIEVTALEHDKRAFHLGPLDLEVPEGGRVAVVGPSGSGKTTLLRCIAGFERPSRGTIAILGRTVHGGGRPVPPQRRNLGFVFQDSALWAHMTASQHIRFVLPEADDARIRAILAEVGLDHLADRKPETFSGGEAQRLGLARALARKPRILLLDEPLRSVDVHQRDGLVALIRRVARDHGLTLVLVTHDREEALAMADDLIVLRKGRVVERGRAPDLLRAPATVFTATFLAGGAALPIARREGGYDTPFGFVRDDGQGAPERRLVVLPGDVEAIEPANASPDLPVALVLCPVPGTEHRAKVELDGHVVTADVRGPLRPGSPVRLRLVSPPRLMPFDGGNTP
ncbi:MAG: hypothetical protein Fur0037_25860 [Planctomycetota bacterium]